MQWQLEKYSVEEFIKVLRKIFRYNSTWDNEEIEIIQFQSGSSQLVFEQFFEENEKYPIITVYGMGGSYMNDSIDDFVSNSDVQELAMLGDRSLAFEMVTSENPVSFKMPKLKRSFLAGFYLSYMWDGSGLGGDDFSYALTRGTGSAQVILASGSMPGKDVMYPDVTYIIFDAPQEMDPKYDHTLNIIGVPDSNYSIMIDPQFPLSYSTPTQEASGSFVGGLLQPPAYSLGGRFEGTITIRVMAKNSSAITRNLGEIITTRILLLKQAQYNRASSADQASSVFAADVTAEWRAKGITIRGVRTGTLEMRKRGINDLIFTYPISVDITTHWAVDVPGEFLDGFNIVTTTFQPE